MFLDKAVIHVHGGVGGSGADAFRREKGVPRGGPSGGDGGKGGDVVMVVNPQLATLIDFSHRRHFRAERGHHGEGSNRTGRGGRDIEIAVPPGTVVRDADSGEILGELLKEDDHLVAARGGRGGRGNARFATATNQAPRRWEPGGEGEKRRIELELKLIADVGLVGEPNAGKSTLLARITRARPKIAAYPFTTIEPNLGVVALSDFRSFVIADIPGIIEGAHEGRGLGLRFLRHIERTRCLAFLIPVDSPDPQEEYARLRAEIEAYSASLSGRSHCVVLSKTDLLGPDRNPPSIDAPEARDSFSVSAASSKGIGPLLEGLWRQVRDAIEGEEGAEETPMEGEW